MATSGSINFSQNRNEIITDILLAIGILGENQSPTDSQVKIVSRVLNRMFKAWQAMGINLWTAAEATIFLRDGVNVYTLSSTGDHAGDNVVETTLSADEAASQTQLSVTSSTNMAAADNIGIELDDGTRQWTTIVSVDSSVLVTVTTALTGAASSGNTVYTYRNRLTKPLKITNPRVREGTDTTDVPVNLLGREEYFLINNKANEGSVTSVYYSPQLDYGLFYVWQTPDNVQDRVKVTYKRIIEDLDAATDTPDLPQEWLEAIIYNGAAHSLTFFNKKLSDYQDLVLMAKQSLEEMRIFDTEESSISIVPNLDNY